MTAVATDRDADETSDAVAGLYATDVQLLLGGRQVLDGVNISITPGELVALVGPNGAGKSSLLGVLTGDLTPSHGSVLLDGVPISRYSPGELARRRAVQLQESRVAFAFTTREVVELGRAPWARTPSAVDDDVAVVEAMSDAEVLDHAEQPFPTLSGGEKARTGFARVLAQRTDVLLLDEPTAALDVRHQEQVLSHARRRATAGGAVLAVLHDLSLAAAYADRVVLLADGRVRADGTPEQVYQADLLTEVYRYPVEVIEHPGGPLVVPVRNMEATS